jgi:predicted small lipoprotein YifL
MPRSTFSCALASPALACVAAALAGCGPGPLPLPPGPDLNALVTKYQAPTGTIDPQNIDDVIAAGQARIGQLQLDWLPDLLAQLMTRLRARLDDNGVPSDPGAAPNLNHPGIDATIRLSQTCRGWDDPPGAANVQENGTLSVTAVIENRTLRRALVAAATSCRGRIQPTNQIALAAGGDLKVFVDGSIGFYFYGPVPRTVAETHALVQISGQVGTMAGGNASGEFDFVIDYPHVEVSLDRPDGNVILEVGLDGVTIRAANATYRCDAALQTCGPG